MAAAVIEIAVEGGEEVDCRGGRCLPLLNNTSEATVADGVALLWLLCSTLWL